MSSFIGWEGCGENICLTINVVSCEANCIVSRDNKYEIFPIDETFTKKILKEKDLILSYSSASDEDYIDDDNVYHFYSFYREKRNKYCLRHTYLKKHPLFNDLVTLIIKIHHKYKFKKLGS